MASILHGLERVPWATIHVASRPRPQSRPRVYRSGVVVSSSKPVRLCKQDIARACRAAALPPPPDKHVAVLLELEAVIPIKDKRRHGQLHTSRPDADNLLKTVKDAIIDAGVLHDDAQIAIAAVRKVHGPYPGAMVISLSTLSQTVG